MFKSKPLTKGSPPPEKPAKRSSRAFRAMVADDEKRAISEMILPLGIRASDVGNRNPHTGDHELHAAAFKGFSEAVDIILKKFQDVIHVDDTNGEGQTPLYLAVAKGHETVVDRLLADGANPNILAKDNTSALNQAIRGAHFQIADKLLVAGANPNAGSPSPFVQAFNAIFSFPNGLYFKSERRGFQYTYNYDFLFRLVQAGADINVVYEGWEGKTPLVEAILMGSRIFMFGLTLARRILESGADTNKTALANGMTALHIACRSNDDSFVQKLLESGANPNTKDINGDMPLHYASQRDYIRILDDLLAAGVDIGPKNKNGQTPLHFAAKGLHWLSLRWLIQNGADINVQDNDGRTPLFLATEATEHLEGVNVENVEENNENEENNDYDQEVENVKAAIRIVKLLLANGADKTIADKDGRVALDVAENEALRRLLSDSRGPSGPPLKWQGWTRGDASMLDGIFADEETAKNFALCPVCMKYVQRSEACMYMSHNCATSKGYYHEKLYKTYKNNAGIINWCTICGRICKGHNHYKLGPANGDIPSIIYGKDPFAKSCEIEGGGGVTEKLLRFRRLREHARDLQAEVGQMGWWEAMDELCEEMWNAPMVRSRAMKTMLEAKKFNIPNTNFPVSLPPQNNAPNLPFTGEHPIIHSEATNDMTNALYIDDTNILQFRHKKANGSWNRHDGPGQQISREAFVGWLKTMLENPTAEVFGKCWQYKTLSQQTVLSDDQKALICDAVLHPEEVKAALDTDDAEQARLAEGYRKAFNSIFDTRRIRRP